MVRGILTSLAFLISATPFSVAQPITGEEARRQDQVIEELKSALAAQPKVEAKFALIEKGMKEEKSVPLRTRMLQVAAGVTGPEIEAFLTPLLTSEADAGIRSRVATLLGLRGSEMCLAALVQCAEKDKTTDVEVGCMRGRSSARRSAIFAIADLAARHPKIAADAAAKLRVLSVKENDEPRFNEQLDDARIQSLYQITRDDTLLKPFYDRLKSKDEKDRRSGVVAFRFLKPKKAPSEVVDALKDTSTDVRQWTALVLGEIADPKTADVLLATACDLKEDTGVRGNAIDAVGRMKIASTAERIEKFLMDVEPVIQTSAAIALYRITGKKVKQFPEGYNAD
jgi:HEAT repeat protein